MDLVEIDAKALLREAGLPVPAGTVVGPDDPVRCDAPVVVKAQVPFGGRGRRGLVVPAAAEDAPAVVATVRDRMRALGFDAPVVLLESPVEVAAEWYLAWRVDDVAQAFAFTFSTAGGIDVEDHAGPRVELAFAPGRAPGAHDFVGPLERAGLQGRALAAACRFAAASWRVFVQADALLLEVNPLALTARGDVVALDAKVALDDNAAHRHRSHRQLLSARLESAGRTALERQAEAAGIAFVELDGRVAVLSGGAGLGMALLDVLADEGLPAANFVDASGGSGAATFDALVRLVFERAARDDVDIILMYFTLSATSLASVVRGVIALLDARPPPKPMVVGLLASGAAEREMGFDEARALLERRGYPCARDLGGVIDALRAARAARAPAPPPPPPAPTHHGDPR